MEFEWDERKRAQILAERALDFVDADLFFDGRPSCHQPTPRGGEERWKTTATINGVHLTLVWCSRDDKIRVITMRRAHETEIKAYRQLHGR
ncbi:MAG: BrnT family toxin [Rhizobiales bacterium]|nr:BrnT family toxin [Hyphomicrobiales bacterium]